MNKIPPVTNNESRTASAKNESRTASAKPRVIKTIPPLEPLAGESRYTETHFAHVSVFTGLFAWAMRQDKLGKRANRKVRLHHRSFGPDGVQAPTQRDRKRATFTNYFALGTQKDLKPIESNSPLNVHRNRILFLAVLTGILVYTLMWISR